MISVGGADHAIFQWCFVTPDNDGDEGAGKDGTMVTLMSQGVESDSEGSDSDASNIESLDSDLEQEQEKSYERDLYRDDLQLLKRKMKEKERGDRGGGKEARSKRGGIKASLATGEGRKGSIPEDSLTLEFVHG